MANNPDEDWLRDRIALARRDTGPVVDVRSAVLQQIANRQIAVERASGGLRELALVSAVSSLAACLALVLVWPVEQALFDPLLGWVNPFTILKP